MENINFVTIFLTGLLTGGLTCMAVQGGLLAATLMQEEEEKLANKIKINTAISISTFLIAKLVAYTILGFLLGWLGSFFQLSILVKVIVQVAVAIFMVGTALHILDVHPIFRYFIIQPPKFLTRLVRKQSKSKELFAPGILGAFTIFIPCGTTQAMMALAIASGTPWIGALVLFLFVLGTSPVFFFLGYFATRLGDVFQEKFMKIAAYAIILLAIFNLNNALALTGTGFTLNNMAKEFWSTLTWNETSAIPPVGEPTKEATIFFGPTGYVPNNLTVRAGSKVTLQLKNVDNNGCIQGFVIPKLGIQKLVRPGTEDTITFNAPTEKGTIEFMCSMGMFRGKINVI